MLEASKHGPKIRITKSGFNPDSILVGTAEIAGVNTLEYQDPFGDPTIVPMVIIDNDGNVLLANPECVEE